MDDIKGFDFDPSNGAVAVGKLPKADSRILICLCSCNASVVRVQRVWSEQELEGQDGVVSPGKSQGESPIRGRDKAV